MLLLGFASASAGTGGQRSLEASSPCHDLSGRFLTVCQQALTACNTAPAGVRATCIDALEKDFDPLRNKGTPKTTTTATTPAGASTGNQPPPPVTGESADVTPVKGTVLVNGKPLTAGERVPIGATVDTTNGTVKLESVSPTGQVQSALFDGAVFKVEQVKHGITELILTGGDFGACSTKGTRRVAAAAPNSNVVRSLWGNGHGQFTTKGRYAAATVRGTWWNTQDRCDGTLIRVKRGVVSVLDLITKQTVDVQAGHNYVAKP